MIKFIPESEERRAYLVAAWRTRYLRALRAKQKGMADLAEGWVKWLESKKVKAAVKKSTSDRADT